MTTTRKSNDANVVSEAYLSDAERELRALYNATSYLLKADTIFSLGEQIVEAVVKEFEHVDCGLMLVDSQQNSIVRLVRRGAYGIQPTAPLRLDSHGLVPLAIRTGEVVYVRDVSVDPDYIVGVPMTRSELVIPLKTTKGVLAVLDLQHSEINAFSERDQRILSAYAVRAAAALEMMQLHDALDRHATELEQRVAERTQELQAAKDRVEAILNNSPNAVMLVGQDLRIQQMNTSVQHLFECQPDEGFDKLVTEFVHPDDLEIFMRAVWDSYRHERDRAVELRARRRNHTTFEVELSVGRINNNGYVCAFRDISEHKSHERQLRYYASLQESVNDAVIAGDFDFCIRSWNKAAEEMYGWLADEVIGKNMFEVVYDTSRAEQYRQEAFQILLNQGVWSTELSHHHKNGTSINVHVTATALKDDKGQAIGVVTVNHNITDRKVQERQLRYHASIQESVKDAVIVTDMEYRIQSWNKAAETIYGWRAEEMVGQVAEVLFPDQVSTKERIHVIRDLGALGVWQGEIIQQRKDGSILSVLSSISQIRDEAGVAFSIVAINRDITERKRAEEALRDSEERFRQYFELPLIGIAITSLEKDWLQVNDKLCEITGYPREELTHKRWDEITHPDDVMADAVHFQKLVSGETDGYSLEKRYIRKDGEIIYVTIDVRAVRKPDGQFSYCVALVQDITERKHAEVALRESEVRYRLLADNATDVITQINIYGECVYVSPSAKSVLGYESTELIGQTMYDLVHPDDLPIMVQRFSSSGFTSISSKALRYRCRHRHGHYVWLESVGRGIRNPDTHEPEGIIASSRAVSDRVEVEEALRESEERFRSIVDSIHDYGICVLDPEGHILSWSPGAERIKGYTAQEIIGQHFERFYTQEDQEHGEPQHILDLARRDTHFTREGWQIRKNGTRFWATVEISALHDKDGNLIGFTKVTNDSSERKRTEETLQMALAKEKELSELKSRFVSMASHEFRTPLATILTITESLTHYWQKMTGEQLQQRLERIKEQISYLTEIMDDVLQLARLQARRGEYNPTPLDVARLCQYVIDEFTSRPEVEHRLVFNAVQGLPNLKLDRKLMRQVLNNLISNAIKYSPKDTIINIDWRRTEKYYVLTVSDQGMGIPEADLTHLFEPFHRASNVGNIAGTGLGLTIMKESLEFHGGTITVESHVNAGTTFTITLPASLEV